MEEPKDWAINLIAAALIGVAILVVIAVRQRRRVNRLETKRPNWTREVFWKEVAEPAFPESYRDVFLRMLQDRAGENFPVLPADSLAFYDIGFALMHEVYLVLTNLFGPEQFGRLAEVPGEMSNAGNVSADGSWRTVANLQIFNHALTKSSHKKLLSKGKMLVWRRTLCPSERSFCDLRLLAIFSGPTVWTNQEALTMAGQIVS